MFVIDTEKHDYIILQINAEKIFFIIQYTFWTYSDIYCSILTLSSLIADT